MSFLVVLGALCFLMLVAYRGFSVILFAPVAALGAVLVTDPSAVLPVYSGLFMDKMVVFVKLYFPVFLLGAVFGKVIELSGFSRSIVASTMRLVGRERAVLAIVIVCAVLTATYRPEQLVGHLQRALDNGLTKDEISEMITHVAFYAGWPASMSAAKIAGEVFAKNP